VEIAHKYVRDAIPHAEEDHYFKDDISKAVELLQSRSMVEEVERKLVELK
jgi:histidine ammonia-lyase